MLKASPDTVKRDWKLARVWLLEQMTGEGGRRTLGGGGKSSSNIMLRWNPRRAGGPHFSNRLAPATTLYAGSSTLFIVPDWKLHVFAVGFPDGSRRLISFRVTCASSAVQVDGSTPFGPTMLSSKLAFGAVVREAPNGSI